MLTDLGIRRLEQEQGRDQADGRWIAPRFLVVWSGAGPERWHPGEGKMLADATAA